MTSREGLIGTALTSLPASFLNLNFNYFELSQFLNLHSIDLSVFVIRNLNVLWDKSGSLFDSPIVHRPSGLKMQFINLEIFLPLSS
jgi:hypothetical protein